MHVASGGKIKRRFSGVGYTGSGLLGNFLMLFSIFFLFFRCDGGFSLEI